MLESAQTIALPAKVTILGCFSRKSENLSKTLGLKSLVSTILISFCQLVALQVVKHQYILLIHQENYSNCL